MRVQDLGFSVIWVDTEESLSTMVQALGTPSRLNIYFEGIDLWRHGQLTCGQFHASGSDTVYVVDFVSLQNPFNLAGGALKTLMESFSVEKSLLILEMTRMLCIINSESLSNTLLVYSWLKRRSGDPKDFESSL